MKFKVCWSCARIYHTKPKCDEHCGDGGYMMASFPWRALTDEKSEFGTAMEAMKDMVEATELDSIKFIKEKDINDEPEED